MKIRILMTNNSKPGFGNGKELEDPLVRRKV
jgi:hypothetical protein